MSIIGPFVIVCAYLPSDVGDLEHILNYTCHLMWVT